MAETGQAVSAEARRRRHLDRLVQLEARTVQTYGELVREHQRLIHEARDVDQKIAEANLDLEGIRAGIAALGGTVTS